MKYTSILAWGAVMALSGVALGAFGAHALKPLLEEYDRQDTYELAVRYQFYHAFALLACGILKDRLNRRELGHAALAFILGIFVFSGSLYVLSMTGLTYLGAITPIGGVAFIVGWLLVIIAALKANKKAV